LSSGAPPPIGAALGRTRWTPAAAVSLILLLALVAGCARSPGSALVLVITVSGSPPAITDLEVTLSGRAGISTQSFTRSDRQALVFPTTLAAQLPGGAGGDLRIDVTAFNYRRITIARGGAGPVAVRAGQTQTVYVGLDCTASLCPSTADARDAGSDGADGATAPEPTDWLCGNGRIDRGESCDTAIATGQPGACPPADCDDGIACTVDTRAGRRCTLTCAHLELTALVAGDGCCPAGATFAVDPDCSPTCGNGAVDRGETCDRAIAAPAGGACPTGDDCDDGDPCTTDLLLAAGTCSARCVHTLVTAAGATAGATDGCCPAGAMHADDADCPVVCGNGVLEPGETCEIGPGVSASDACPTGCDDGDPCTFDQLEGHGCQTGCRHIAITGLAAGDGCCPPGANRALDDDCPAVCGNGVLEAGETCDPRIAGGAGACPQSCPSPSACLLRALVGDAAHCSARCAIALVTACSPQRDGCCPTGCTPASDPDCSPACGNGAVDANFGETCDRAIAGGPGACPTSCPPCTQVLVGAGTCQATCVFAPVTDFIPGDGCCPSGGTFNLDPDCQPACGNGVVEAPAETCDSPLAPGACAGDCPPDGQCTSYRAQGSPRTCDFRCVVASSVTLCRDGDGCCPSGCSAADDGDCAAVCGNGVVEASERCDKGITTGQPGACQQSCDDGDPCTADFASGAVESCSRVCRHVAITACAGGDRCCPPGCGGADDADCAGVCGDGQIGAGETCDPRSTCPTVCPDDGDRCTLERLIGDPLLCNAACVHTPITACSGPRADGCCPTGCDAGSDVDC
jgi:hypothetical protein